MKKSLKILGVVVSIIILSIIVLVVKQYPELNRGKESVQKIITDMYKTPTLEVWQNAYIPEVNYIQVSKEDFNKATKSQNEKYGQFEDISNLKIDIGSYYYRYIIPKEKRDAIKGDYVIGVYTGILNFEKGMEKIKVIFINRGGEWKLVQFLPIK